MTYYLGSKIEGYIYEIGMITEDDAKNYTVKFISEKVLTDNEIESNIYNVTDGVLIETIKRVTKYKRKTTKTATSEKGVRFTGAYKLNGVDVRTNSLYLPQVVQTNMVVKLENAFKQLLGNEFTLVTYQRK